MRPITGIGSDVEHDSTELVARLRAPWRKLRPIPPAELADCPCAECDDLRSVFSNVRPDRVFPEVIDAHYSSLPLFTPSAYRAYLGPYLIRGVEAPDPWRDRANDVLQFSVYSVTLREEHLERGPDAWWRERHDPMSSEQSAAIAEVITIACCRDSDLLSEAQRTWADAYWLSKAHLTRKDA
jgi:hypothetical protein